VELMQKKVTWIPSVLKEVMLEFNSMKRREEYLIW
jgi:hypothetical protein